MGVLSATGKLPNVTVAHPGERWSDCKAAGPITPGAAICPANFASAAASGRAETTPGNARPLKQVEASDTVDSRQVALALRTIVPPYEQSVTDGTLADDGPNELVNRVIASGEYLIEQKSGAFNLTLVEPRSDYRPSQIIGWNPAATRPAGKRGVSNAEVGAWSNTSRKAGTDFLEVLEVLPYGDNGEVLLIVRSLRSQHV